MLLAVDVSRAGRPVLLADEVEIKAESPVTVLLQRKLQKGATLIDSCTCTITNFRLLFITTSSTGAHAGQGLSLSKVAAADDCSSFFNPTSTRINVAMIQSTTQAAASSETSDIGLKFVDRKSSGVFLSLIRKALEKKSWTSMNAAPVTASSAGAAPGAGLGKPNTTLATEHVFNVRSAGVAGILRKQDDVIKSTDSLTKSALSDLSSLMDRAREVVAVVQRYSAYVEQESNSGGSETSSVHSGSSPLGIETVEMSEILQSIGIVSPTTRFSAGKLFHEQLLQEIADLLLTVKKGSGGRCLLEKLGGMVTLTDLYCIVNRARGTEMISPDDLLGACNLVRGRGGGLGTMLGIRTKVFPSGVTVLQHDSMNDEAICRKILDELQQRRAREGVYSSCIDVSLYASSAGFSVVVAREHLCLAESMGVLCRDESMEGLFFYRNAFAELA